jgi:hypothetical protein
LWTCTAKPPSRLAASSVVISSVWGELRSPTTPWWDCGTCEGSACEVGGQGGGWRGQGSGFKFESLPPYSWHCSCLTTEIFQQDAGGGADGGRHGTTRGRAGRGERVSDGETFSQV